MRRWQIEVASDEDPGRLLLWVRGPDEDLGRYLLPVPPGNLGTAVHEFVAEEYGLERSTIVGRGLSHTLRRLYEVHTD